MPVGVARSDCGEQAITDVRAVSFQVETFGTGRIPDAEITSLVVRHFEFRLGLSSGWPGSDGPVKPVYTGKQSSATSPSKQSPQG